MRYGGNFAANFSEAIKSRDPEFRRDVLLDQVAKLISEKPTEIKSALRSSGIKISDHASVKQIIDAVSRQLTVSNEFRMAMALLIQQSVDNAEKKETFSNAIATVIAQAVAQVTNSTFGYFQSKEDRKAEEERTKAELYAKLLGGGEKKSNWVPVVVISGVLVIGGLVLFLTLRPKK